MHINLSKTPSVASFLNEHVIHPLTKHQRKIVVVATLALAFLSACFVLKKCMFRVKPLDGKGKLTKQGTVYEGVFKDGKLNGKGSITRPDGTKEEGEFKDNLFDGRGKIRSANGMILVEGSFKDGKLEGKGKSLDIDGTVFEGEFQNNLPHGPGRYSERDGTVFEGEYYAGYRHGQGKIIKNGTETPVEYQMGKRIEQNDAKLTDE